MCVVFNNVDYSRMCHISLLCDIYGIIYATLLLNDAHHFLYNHSHHTYLTTDIFVFVLSFYLVRLFHQAAREQTRGIEKGKDEERKRDETRIKTKDYRKIESGKRGGRRKGRKDREREGERTHTHTHTKPEPTSLNT